jgi:2-keto-4-pentenoate hydratase/2-oxohepta-3-ene-1,7-dioic acid hydratase in catechol pathway
MRVVSFQLDGRSSYGVTVEDGVVNAMPLLGEQFSTLKEVLAADAVSQLAPLLEKAADLPLTDVELLPVIPDASKTFCVGINYKSHIKEMKREAPKYPWIFTRSNHCQVGHDESIVRPSASDWFDFEGELAVIIGKEAHHVTRKDALDYVAGYSCFNDGSIRDFQRHSPLFTSGKNFYKSGGFGPWMVTRDDIPDPTALLLETRLNGVTMQSASVSDLCFDIPYLIEYLSTLGPLYPGDVIVTGTPGGVGFARDPHVWMQPGDIVEVEISSIGILRNTVVAE